MQTTMKLKRIAIITGWTWDRAQEEIRKFGKESGLSISPKGYLPLERARVESLSMRLPSAIVNIADFRPFFENDRITLKYISVEYHENQGIEPLLRILGANL